MRLMLRILRIAAVSLVALVLLVMAALYALTEPRLRRRHAITPHAITLPRDAVSLAEGEQTWRNATDHAFFIILNVAIGGAFPWAECTFFPHTGGCNTPGAPFKTRQFPTSNSHFQARQNPWELVVGFWEFTL